MVGKLVYVFGPFPLLNRLWHTPSMSRFGLFGQGGDQVQSSALPRIRHNWRMKSQYRGHRFPAEIISHAVWLYHCVRPVASIPMRAGPGSAA